MVICKGDPKDSHSSGEDQIQNALHSPGRKKNMVFKNILKNSYIYKSLYISKKFFGNMQMN